MPDITSNLVAHYKLDETSGTSAADSSGNGNTGTYVNTPTLGQVGALSGSSAVKFARASSQYVNCPISSPVGAVCTVSFWFKLFDATSENYARAVILKSSGYENIITFYRITNTLNINCRVSNVWGTDVASAVPSIGQWYHVVAVSDGTNVKVYVNGVYVLAHASAFSNPLFSVLQIAGDSATGDYCNDTIDDVRIYNRALTAEDVAFLFRFGADITSQLVAHYKLDEISGTSAADSSGNGNTGTYTNSPTLNQAGAWSGGKAVTLNGVNQHILSTDITQLNSVSAFTFSAWIYCNGNVTFSQIFGKIGASVNSRIFLGFYPDNTSLFLCVSNGGDTKGNTASVIPQNTWVHVTMVFDGTLTGDANRLKVYVNAVQKTITQFGAAVPATTANLAGYIADIGYDGGSPFKGTLDDVRIYSRALSASDVSALYAYSGNPDITSGLVAHYKLDESGGTTAVDSSGNGYTGTYARDAANTTVSSQINKGYDGNGSSDYIVTAIPTSMLPSSGTMALWIKDLSVNYQVFIAKGVNDQISFFADSALSSLIFRSNAPSANDLTWVMSSTSGWHHYCATWSGTSGAIYKDGVLVSSGTLNAIPAANAKTWRIGQFDATVGGYWIKDPIDDVRIYSRALAPDEVAYLYSMSLSAATSILQAPAKTITEVSPLMVANATYPYIFRSRTL